METSPSALGSGVQWSENAVHIKDFNTKYPLPNVVKVIKGQYRNIGVSKSVNNELYLHSIQTTKKIVAEAVKVKEGKTKVTVSDQKYSLPLSYKGWFELLSQDGKAIRAIQSVQELSKFFPPSCLVRENIRGFIHKGSRELSLDQTRTIQAGEVLTLSGEIWVPFSMGKVLAKRRILKCVDTNNEEVFFGLEQKGLFSPIAGQNNISGVHNIKGLLDKFRLPLMVRLVHGVIPSKMERGFSGIFRLVNMYTDENAFVCPFKRETKMVPISTREPIKIVAVQNLDILSQTELCQVIHNKCDTMLESYMNSIHILFSAPEPTSVIMSPNEDNTNSKLLSGPHKMENKSLPGAISKDEEDLIFQEIDGIYQYVREGGLPPAPKVRPPKTTVKPAAPKPPMPSKLLDSVQTLAPGMEIKMQHLDLPPEDEEDPIALKRQESYSWEEPIYEPLHKIREQKRKLEEAKRAHKMQSISDIPSETEANPIKNMLSGFDTPPDEMSLNESNPKESPASVEPSPVTPISPPDLGVPVANLRQVMRHLSMETPMKTKPEAIRPRSLSVETSQARQTIEEVYNVLPPPVPPKRYSVPNASPTKPNFTKPSSGPVNVTVPSTPTGKSNGTVINSYSHTMTNANRPTKSSPVSPMAVAQSRYVSPSYNTSSSSGSSNSNQKSENKLRHNISVPAPSPSHPHPPYVAVARVGDYKDHTASVVVNHDVYKQRNGIDNRRKLQSMRL